MGAEWCSSSGAEVEEKAFGKEGEDFGVCRGTEWEVHVGRRVRRQAWSSGEGLGDAQDFAARGPGQHHHLRAGRREEGSGDREGAGWEDSGLCFRKQRRERWHSHKSM